MMAMVQHGRVIHLLGRKEGEEKNPGARMRNKLQAEANIALVVASLPVHPYNFNSNFNLSCVKVCCQTAFQADFSKMLFAIEMFLLFMASLCRLVYCNVNQGYTMFNS